MNIAVLTGSPHRAGTSALLADEFLRGAQERGHETARFDAAFTQVHPCLGCDKCGCGSAPCVFRDDFAAFAPRLEEADLVAFVTPLYYHGASAQLKAAIDRFHGIDGRLRGAPKRAVLLVTAADALPRIMTGVVGSYLETLHYLKWTDVGRVLALGCGERADLERTDYPAQAYRLGRSL